MLRGRVALVSGASSGLGQAVAQLFAAEGAALALLARRVERLEALEREIHAGGGVALALPCDVSDLSAVSRAVERALERFSRVDVLVNNAAVLVNAPTLATSPDEWLRSVATNLNGAFFLLRLVVPGMVEQGYGRVINVTSGWSCDGAPGHAAYAATKAGIDSLTRSLAAELAGTDVLVNALDPGEMLTEMWPEGRDPGEVAPDVLRLATLPRGGWSGRVVRSGQPW